MTDAALLRAMAQWYRDGNKFVPQYHGVGCGCFYAATSNNGSLSFRAEHFLGEVIGIYNYDPFYAEDLIRLGWTGPECTDDAIAACEIAADLAS